MSINNKQQQKVVGIYGSANMQPGDPDYIDAHRLGEQLARANYAVMTGGYSGAMAAASQGAAEANGHVIGVTVGLFRERGLVPNPFLHEEVHLPSLAERLNYLIVKPDAYVFLKGGAGTLSEMALAWSLLQVAEVPARPMVLVGPMWRDFVPHFAAISSITPRDMQLLIMVETVDQVIPAMEAWWANPPRIPSRLGDVAKIPPLGDKETL
ncbi:MAG: LOG family protein [Anaerolineae bacterium]|nr:LOG family protein [Anaerolineae bacterium]